MEMNEEIKKHNRNLTLRVHCPCLDVTLKIHKARGECQELRCYLPNVYIYSPSVHLSPTHNQNSFSCSAHASSSFSLFIFFLSFYPFSYIFIFFVSYCAVVAAIS